MISFKKFGFLEIIVTLSAIYVLSTLIWTHQQDLLLKKRQIL